jgi:hypothetical protein
MDSYDQIAVKYSGAKCFSRVAFSMILALEWQHRIYVARGTFERLAR